MIKKYIEKIGLLSLVFGLIFANTTVFALPSQATTVHTPTTSSVRNNDSISRSANGQNIKQAHLAAAQLKVCQNRQSAINNIITRINTRVQNQITLFSTIALRVETFYTNQGKIVSNYSQLLANINSAAQQAKNNMVTMNSSGIFSCSLSDPKGMVTSFQGYLKTEITDLQNYRLAVKNLIVAVASANGVNVSTSNQTHSSQRGN